MFNNYLFIYYFCYLRVVVVFVFHVHTGKTYTYIYINVLYWIYIWTVCTSMYVCFVVLQLDNICFRIRSFVFFLYFFSFVKQNLLYANIL